MRKTTLVAVALIAAVAIAGTAGCRRVKLADDPQTAISTETTTVALAGADALATNVRMGVGELKLRAGEPSSTAAMNGTFTYAPASWKPQVAYSVVETRGVLSIEQPESSGPEGFGRAKNTWVVTLAPDVPTSLSVKLGVGEGTLDLRGMDLTGLEVLTGLGQSTIDLSGERTRDLTARIECGVGDVELSVPNSVGVRIVGGSDGLGDLEADGFSRDGDDLVNAAWSAAGPKLQVFMTRGVGDVKVVSVD
jgi:hypothetical protein